MPRPQKQRKLRMPRKIYFFLALFALGSPARAQTAAERPVADPIPGATLRGSLPEEKPVSFDGTFDCEKFKSKNIGCDPNTVVTHCKDLSKKIPRAEALAYTLQYFFENHGQLRDARCALASDTVAAEVFSEEEVKGGITAPRFMLRDMATAKASQVDSYLVDLCSGDFKEFKSNIGTGTSRDSKGFVDVDDKHTTLTGAFLTDDKTSRLVPANPKDYKRIMKNFGDKTRVYLVGLNSSNNSTVLSKPMHISPYTSSWGCPSVVAQDADVLTRLVKDGQRSLVITYDKESMQKLGEGAVCTNGEGRAGYKATDVRAAKPAKKRNQVRQRRNNRGRR